MKDKYGTNIQVGTKEIDDDVLFDGIDYFRIYTTPDGTIEMLGRTGYIHNVTHEKLSKFERIGKYADQESLFVVD